MFLEKESVVRDGLLHDNETSLPQVYTAGVDDLPTRVLTGCERADVAVVGAGLTGLSAALHAARLGMKVAVVEANGIGTGASGRSFGQVVPYLKHEPGHALKLFGETLGERLVTAAASGPDFVFELVKTYQIACEAVQGGLIFAAHSSEGLERLKQRAAFWRKRGLTVDILDRDETSQAIGGGDYPGALLDHRGGTLNSFAFTVGLARAAAANGVGLFCRSPAEAIRRHDASSWELKTGSGTLIADKILVCTNAYRNDLAPGVGAHVLPIRVHQVASEPLRAEIASTILPGGRALTDTRRLPSGVRLTRDGRLVVTIEGPLFSSGGGNIGHASARIAGLFPHLGRVTWQSSWSGWIDMAPDQYPRIIEAAPGIMVGLGLSGRGLALGPLIGRDLARLCAGAHYRELAFPVVGPQDGPRWPMGAKAIAGAAALQRRWMDRVDLWNERRWGRIPSASQREIHRHAAN
ncbi:FAD-binding oxidoreductase [Bradyrhizobium frederickii]|uniref:FAD-binding oxidoreductase n=1 Tax=Bradyrhizobium frederickii TaxID=2560054 RepID=A0A4Y9L4B1_9BRAD|nr:FAD-binding oxidoreductase [Bradyrhizobium frederickii]TFV37636.1 FAD-binding oxidoreductase [Bradyrhizobium frederickii]